MGSSPNPDDRAGGNLDALHRANAGEIGEVGFREREGKAQFVGHCLEWNRLNLDL